MKKVNFFNFPSLDIDVTKLTNNNYIRKKRINKHQFKKIKFTSWCSRVKINNEKIKFVVRINNETYK